MRLSLSFFFSCYIVVIVIYTYLKSGFEDLESDFRYEVMLSGLVVIIILAGLIHTYFNKEGKKK